jgi:hypothetical protein
MAGEYLDRDEARQLFELWYGQERPTEERLRHALQLSDEQYERLKKQVVGSRAMEQWMAEQHPPRRRHRLPGLAIIPVIVLAAGFALFAMRSEASTLQVPSDSLQTTGSRLGPGVYPANVNAAITAPADSLATVPTREGDYSIRVTHEGETVTVAGYKAHEEETLIREIEELVKGLQITAGSESAVVSVEVSLVGHSTTAELHPDSSDFLQEIRKLARSLMRPVEARQTLALDAPAQ